MRTPVIPFNMLPFLYFIYASSQEVLPSLIIKGSATFLATSAQFMLGIFFCVYAPTLAQYPNYHTDKKLWCRHHSTYGAYLTSLCTYKLNSAIAHHASTSPSTYKQYGYAPSHFTYRHSTFTEHFVIALPYITIKVHSSSISHPSEKTHQPAQSPCHIAPNCISLWKISKSSAYNHCSYIFKVGPAMLPTCG